MKKNFLYIAVLLLLLSTGSLVQAQYSDYYYHRVGDTIEWQANNGYYSWWEFETFFQQNLTVDDISINSMCADFLDSAIVLMEYYTPTPLKIIGIAGTGFRGRYTYNSWSTDQPENGMYQEYYYVYQYHSQDMFLKALQPWTSLIPRRTLHFKIHRSWFRLGDSWEEAHTEQRDSCCRNKPEEIYLPLYEYYFDSAIYVHDTFYVGGSYFGNMLASLTGNPSSDSIHTKYWYVEFRDLLRHISCNAELQRNDCRFLQGVSGKIKQREVFHDDPALDTPSFHQLPWRNRDTSLDGRVMLVYPIVEVDTTVPPADACPPVAGIEAFVSGTTATVTWDDFPNYTAVHLSYGPCNVPQSQWTTIDVTDASHYTLQSLNPSACYKVSLSVECDKTETTWSAPVTFLTGQDTATHDTTDTTGIRPTALSQLTFLAPNPANSEVTVSSGFSLQEIDIWTIGGVWVHHQPVSGHQATVDISILPPGTYIVAIRTHDGTTHKKLVIK